MSEKYEKRDIRQEITNGIIEQLEKGVMPWRKNWENVAPPGLPANGETGRVYNGGNRVGLMVAMHERGWEDHRFMTFQQLRKLDAGPGAGERGTPVEYWEKRDFWMLAPVPVSAGRRLSIGRNAIFGSAKIAWC